MDRGAKITSYSCHGWSRSPRESRVNERKRAGLDVEMLGSGANRLEFDDPEAESHCDHELSEKSKAELSDEVSRQCRTEELL